MRGLREDEVARTWVTMESGKKDDGVEVVRLRYPTRIRIRIRIRGDARIVRANIRGAAGETSARGRGRGRETEETTTEDETTEDETTEDETTEDETTEDETTEDETTEETVLFPGPATPTKNATKNPESPPFATAPARRTTPKGTA
jgi:hypothetical protein